MIKVITTIAKDDSDRRGREEMRRDKGQDREEGQER